MCLHCLQALPDGGTCLIDDIKCGINRESMKERGIPNRGGRTQRDSTNIQMLAPPTHVAGRDYSWTFCKDTESQTGYLDFLQLQLTSTQEHGTFTSDQPGRMEVVPVKSVLRLPPTPPKALTQPRLQELPHAPA